MNELKVFQYYVRIKLHFTEPKFDFFEVKKTKISVEKYLSRNDHSLFSIISKNIADPPTFFLANFSEKNYHISDLAMNHECVENHNRWLGVRKSYSYTLKNDLTKLDKEDFSSNKAFLKYLMKEIDKETFCYVLRYYNALEQYDKLLQNDTLWKETGLLVKKYIAFLPKQNIKYDQIVLDSLGEKLYK